MSKMDGEGASGGGIRHDTNFVRDGYVSRYLNKMGKSMYCLGVTELCWSV